ncbi:MAG: hypothetical protein GY937_24660 [bacterium]|nr:hypothetical protein [bacterium]
MIGRSRTRSSTASTPLPRVRPLASALDLPRPNFQHPRAPLSIARPKHLQQLCLDPDPSVRWIEWRLAQMGSAQRLRGEAVALFLNPTARNTAKWLPKDPAERAWAAMESA